MTRTVKIQRGFTLVEAVAVIAITGILAAAVAVFIRAPVRGFVDSVRRAEMTDIADLALRRMERDVRLALPNSVRVDATGRFIEFLQTRSGGRYREEKDNNGAGNPLEFNVTDTKFDILGPLPALSSGDQLVVYNLGIPGADAYAGNNNTAYTSLAGAEVTMSAKKFPFASPGGRFHVVATPVTYHCDLANGVLRRYWGYAIQAAQPTNPAGVPLAGASSAILAGHVSACSFTYDANVVAQRAGLVTMRLGITMATPDGQNETVTLYHAAHVDNVP
ncbi:MAG: prepilin-type N-terminal cleavage/methylation domain-containing protein [Pseudomonadota bacterium]